jgi:hypothetical protein
MLEKLLHLILCVVSIPTRWGYWGYATLARWDSGYEFSLLSRQAAKTFSSISDRMELAKTEEELSSLEPAIAEFTRRCGHHHWETKTLNTRLAQKRFFFKVLLSSMADSVIEENPQLEEKLSR